MSMDDDSKISCKNSASFGLHSSRKIEEAGEKHFQNRRFTTWVGIVIFLFIIFLATFFAYWFCKTKEAFKLPEANKYDEANFLDDIKVLPRTSKRNVQIIPYNHHRERRISQHPNHRYTERESEEKLYKKMMRDFHKESGWSPKPFQKQIKGPFNNIQDIIAKGEIKNREAKGKDKLHEIMKGLGSPLHLKGFYVEPDYEEGDDEENVSENSNEYSDNYHYLKKINELMENEPKESQKREKWVSSKKGYGQPFKLPIKEKKIVPETLKRLEASDSKNKNHWTNPNFRKNKKKSITILLDIYPLIRNHYEYKGHHDGSKSWLRLRKPQNGVIYTPTKFKNKNTVASPSSNFPILYTGDGNGRMIMKLNLYPKNKSRRDTNILIKEVAYQENKKEAGKRTFGLFSKYKKKKHQPKRCSVMSFRPYGKPIKAKWKDKNGKWVSAELVKVKRLIH